MLENLSIKIFADGADRARMLEMYDDPLISGFTTNPTLLREAGVIDYRAFAREMIARIPDRPIFLEVLSDDFAEMELQALEIASWGSNVYVKIPVTNSHGESSGELIRRVAAAGVRVNVTALMTQRQVSEVIEPLANGPDCFLSVFSGRIADTGRDPAPLMAEVVRSLLPYPNLQVIWASSRELLNIFQADAVGCDVITVTYDLLRKLTRIGASLDQLSLETVQMFHRDAVAAGLQLPLGNVDRAG